MADLTFMRSAMNFSFKFCRISRPALSGRANQPTQILACIQDAESEYLSFKNSENPAAFAEKRLRLGDSESGIYAGCGNRLDSKTNKSRFCIFLKKEDSKTYFIFGAQLQDEINRINPIDGDLLKVVKTGAGRRADTREKGTAATFVITKI